MGVVKVAVKSADMFTRQRIVIHTRLGQLDFSMHAYTIKRNSDGNPFDIVPTPVTLYIVRILGGRLSEKLPCYLLNHRHDLGLREGARIKCRACPIAGNITHFPQHHGCDCHLRASALYRVVCIANTPLVFRWKAGRCAAINSMVPIELAMNEILDIWADVFIRRGGK